MPRSTVIDFSPTRWSAEENADLIRLFESENRDIAAVAQKLGRSRASAYAQASRLGLLRTGSGAKIRNCRCCERDFFSEGIFERICGCCKATELYRYA